MYPSTFSNLLLLLLTKMCCDSCSGENNETYQPPATDKEETGTGTDSDTGTGTSQPKPGPSGTTKPSRGERDKEDPADSGGTGNGTETGPGPVPPFGQIPGGRRRRIRRLWCQTGYDVAVFPNGKVRGTKSPRNKYGMLCMYVHVHD